jgi:hypothetical protein
MMEPLAKIFNRSSILFSFLASLFALLKLNSESISAFVGFVESLWRKETMQEFEVKIQHRLAEEKQIYPIRRKQGLPLKYSAVSRYLINWVPRLMRCFIRGYKRKSRGKFRMEKTRQMVKDKTDKIK